MQTVKQALDDTENYLRSQLKQFGFCDRCKFMDVSAIKGRFTGKVSEDGKAWYPFSVSGEATKVDAPE